MDYVCNYDQNHADVVRMTAPPSTGTISSLYMPTLGSVTRPGHAGTLITSFPKMFFCSWQDDLPPGLSKKGIFIGVAMTGPFG